MQLAQLVYQPPGLGLADKDPVASKKKGPGLSRAEKRLAVAKKFSAKRQVYENCRMLSQAGELLCFCDMRKVRWYEVRPSFQALLSSSVKHLTNQKACLLTELVNVSFTFLEST